MDITPTTTKHLFKTDNSTHHKTTAQKIASSIRRGIYATSNTLDDDIQNGLDVVLFQNFCIGALTAFRNERKAPILTFSIEECLVSIEQTRNDLLIRIDKEEFFFHYQTKEGENHPSIIHALSEKLCDQILCHSILQKDSILYLIFTLAFSSRYKFNKQLVKQAVLHGMKRLDICDQDREVGHALAKCIYQSEDVYEQNVLLDITTWLLSQASQNNRSLNDKVKEMFKELKTYCDVFQWSAMVYCLLQDPIKPDMLRYTIEHMNPLHDDLKPIEALLAHLFHRSSRRDLTSPINQANTKQIVLNEIEGTCYQALTIGFNSMYQICQTKENKKMIYAWHNTLLKALLENKDNRPIVLQDTLYAIPLQEEEGKMVIQFAQQKISLNIPRETLLNNVLNEFLSGLRHYALHDVQYFISYLLNQKNIRPEYTKKAVLYSCTHSMQVTNDQIYQAACIMHQSFGDYSLTEIHQCATTLLSSLQTRLDSEDINDIVQIVLNSPKEYRYIFRWMASVYIALTWPCDFDYFLKVVAHMVNNKEDYPHGMITKVAKRFIEDNHYFFFTPDKDRENFLAVFNAPHQKRSLQKYRDGLFQLIDSDQVYDIKSQENGKVIASGTKLSFWEENTYKYTLDVDKNKEDIASYILKHAKHPAIVLCRKSYIEQEETMNDYPQ